MTLNIQVGSLPVEVTPNLLRRVMACWSLDTATGCWVWQHSINEGGYGRLRVCPSRVIVLAHRLSYALFVGEIGEMFVCHKCDNPKCVNPNHLFLGTHADNMSDMVSKGRSLGWYGRRRGDNNPNTKIPDRELPTILALHASGVSQRELCRRYNVSWGAINRIVKGRRT